MSGLVVARNCCLARMLPGEAELVSTVSEWTGLPGRAKSVQRFERYDGLDSALYKNYLYRFNLITRMVWLKSSQCVINRHSSSCSMASIFVTLNWAFLIFAVAGNGLEKYCSLRKCS